MEIQRWIYVLKTLIDHMSNICPPPPFNCGKINSCSLKHGTVCFNGSLNMMPFVFEYVCVNVTKSEK